MSEKRSSPLNNPLQEKVAVAANLKENKGDSVSKGSERGVSKGGGERVKPAEAILLCQCCRQLQKLVFRVGSPPEWHRCIGCGELQPTDGYKVIAYGLMLPLV